MNQNNSSANSNQNSSEFTICKKEKQSGKEVSNKTAQGLNEAVAECCKCESIDNSAKSKAPSYQNTAEDAQKAAKWLSDTSSKYNFEIKQGKASSQVEGDKARQEEHSR